MAIYENLPVYKAAYDLFQDITLLWSQMKRDYKFTIGEQLLNETIDNNQIITWANNVYKPLGGKFLY